MYTEDDLRAVFGDVEREAPDPTATLAGLDRLRRRRTVRRTALGMAAAVLTTVAVAATALVVAELTDNPTTAAPPGTPLLLTFAVDPVPGSTVTALSRDATRQEVFLRTADSMPTANEIITVYPPGTYQPADARTGEPVRVRGRPGYFRPDLPCQCDAKVGRPTIAWEYAANAWVTAADARYATVLPKGEMMSTSVPSVDGLLAGVKANLSRTADAVRFDRTTQLLIPFRIGYLPAGLRPRSAMVQFDAQGTPQSVLLGLPTVGDIAFEAAPSNGNSPPVGQSRVGPTSPIVDQLGPPRPREGVVNFGAFSVRLNVVGLSDEEIFRILRSITPADFGDPGTWFDAEEAVPNG